MSNAENDFSFNTSTVSIASPEKSVTTQINESSLQDISLSSTLPICRICHCSGEEEHLIEPCRCSGSVRYAHSTCLRTWIVGSGITSCELCNYKFRTKRKHIKDIRKLKFPRPSIKGWLHISLFLAFFSIMLTSLTWVLWSQISSSKEAQAERESKEINYAYALNGAFIMMALIGLYLDSFSQCRSYYRRWALLNEHLVILPYDKKEDTVEKILTDHLPQTSCQISAPHHVRLTISSHRVLINDVPCGDMVLPSSEPVWTTGVREYWSDVISPNDQAGEDEDHLSVPQIQSSSIELDNCAILKETYV